MISDRSDDEIVETFSGMSVVDSLSHEYLVQYQVMDWQTIPVEVHGYYHLERYINKQR